MPLKTVKTEEEYFTDTDTFLNIVMFSAAWCGPCKSLTPHIEDLSNKYPDVTFLKVEEETVPEVFELNAIMAFPTFVFFQNGNEVYRRIGVSSLEDFENLVLFYKSPSSKSI